ncbi:hypothetical protein DMENIID0001_043320 [Sergentomyia squamirostris]
MVHLSDKVKITVFLVCAVTLASAKHQVRSGTLKNVKRESPVGGHYGAFGHQQNHQFNLQALSHQGFDGGNHGSHYVMPQFTYAAAPHQLHAAATGHQTGFGQAHSFAHGGSHGGSNQFAQLAKVLNTQGQVGGHGGGFGQFGQTGGIKTAPVTFSAAPSMTYGTPAIGGHFGGGNLGGLQTSGGFTGGHHGYAGSLGGLGGASFGGHSFGGHSLGGHSLGGYSLGGQSHGGGALFAQNYAPSYHNQLPALPQASSVQTVPAYAVGIKGLGHYSSHGGVSSGAISGASGHQYDLGTQAATLGSHGDLGTATLGSHGDFGTGSLGSGSLGSGSLGSGSLGSGGFSFDSGKYNFAGLTSGKNIGSLAYGSPSSSSSIRHTSISNIMDQVKNPFKPSILLGMYSDALSSGENHGFGGQNFANIKFAQSSLPSYGGHSSASTSYESPATYSNTGYNTINYSEGSAQSAGH